MHNRYLKIVVLLFANCIHLTALAESTEKTIDISAEGCTNVLHQVLQDTLPFTLTAEPLDGYQFAMWSDGNTTNPRTIPAGFSDISLQAVFIPILPDSDPNLAKEHSIMVKADNCNTAYSAKHYYGDILSITAVPTDACGTFKQWSDGNSDNPRSVVVTGDATYTAEFTKVQYTITATADNAEHGSVSVSAE